MNDLRKGQLFGLPISNVIHVPSGVLHFGLRFGVLWPNGELADPHVVHKLFDLLLGNCFLPFLHEREALLALAVDMKAVLPVNTKGELISHIGREWYLLCSFFLGCVVKITDSSRIRKSPIMSSWQGQGPPKNCLGR